MGQVKLVKAGVRNREISGLRAVNEPDLDRGLAAWRRHKRAARAEAAVAGSEAQQQRQVGGRQRADGLSEPERLVTRGAAERAAREQQLRREVALFLEERERLVRLERRERAEDVVAERLALSTAGGWREGESRGGRR